MNLSDIREQFREDVEFLKLCDRRNEVDLSLAALELARDYYPELDFDYTLQWIDERADEIRQKIFTSRAPSGQAELLAELLGRKHGLRGESQAFLQAEGSFLNSVIDTGRGIPISLSVAYLVVARRAGIDLHGVAAPSHFLTRLETIEGPVFIDAYTPGRFLRYDECADWIQTIADCSRRDARSGIKPVGSRVIINRMLNNLKVLYIEQQQWLHALRIQNRLLLLNPSQYACRRDLALISLKAGRPGEALALLRRLLPTAPDLEQETLQRQIRLAFNEVTRWN
ncbi:MAG: transglutaminase-like domain-containing protein [Planctomycetaceae bacterium]|nr:tetratricopeptide repeat protein [Planctomycetaceae bacterium]